MLKTFIMPRKCLMSCWMKVQNLLLKEENPWSLWEISSGQRYVLSYSISLVIDNKQE